MKSDNHFEQLSQRFARNIYATDKGQIRLQLLQQDLAELVTPADQKIFDAGGGQGQLARWCAQQGNQIVLCDLSTEMLSQAALANQQQKLSGQFELIESSIEQFCQTDQRPGKHGENKGIGLAGPNDVTDVFVRAKGAIEFGVVTAGSTHAERIP